MLCGSVDARRAGEYMAEVRKVPKAKDPAPHRRPASRPETLGDHHPPSTRRSRGKRLAGKPHEPFERASRGGRKPDLLRLYRRKPTRPSDRPDRRRWIGAVVLAFDRTCWKFGRYDINILMLAIIHNGIAIPLMWDVSAEPGTPPRLSGAPFCPAFAPSLARPPSLD